MGTVRDILFEEQRPPYLPKVVFVKFDKYNGPTIKILKGKVVSIPPVKHIWVDKNVTHSRL